MGAGIVVVSEELLLEWLQYKGGHVLAFERDEKSLAWRLAIEHEDMPPTRPGERYQIVALSYTAKYGENGQVISITRDERG